MRRGNRENNSMLNNSRVRQNENSNLYYENNINNSMNRESNSMVIHQEHYLFPSDNISIIRNQNIGRNQNFFDDEDDIDDDNFLVNNILDNNGNNNIFNQREQQINRGGYRGNNRGGYRGNNRSGYRGNNRGGYRGNNRGGYRGNNRGGYRGNNRSGNRGNNRGGYRGNNRGNERSFNMGFNRGRDNYDDNDNDDNYDNDDNNNERDYENGLNRMFRRDNREGGNRNVLNIRNPMRNKYISYEQMEELYNGDINDTIQYLYNEVEFDKMIKATEFKIQMIFMFMNIIRRIIESNSPPSYHIVSILLDNTSFFKDQVKKYLKEKKNIDMKYLRFVNDYLFFYKKVLDKFSGKYKLDLWTLEVLVKELQKKCTQISDEQNDFEIELSEISFQIIDNFNEINEKLKAKQNESLLDRFKNLNVNDTKNKEKDNHKYDKIPIDYKEKEIEIPKNELYQNIEKEIVPHLTKGSYLSNERYINTLFYLEYEDCYRSLRKTINSLYNEGLIEPIQIEKKYKDIYYYFNASLLEVEATNEGIIIAIDFQAPKIVKFTKRMIYGSLLILSPEDFSDFLFVTVHYNPYIKNRNNNSKKIIMKLPREPIYRILVKLINPSKETFKFLVNFRNINLQIFESKAYFESYIHILRRLKQINAKELPFKNELIDVNFKDIKAYYLLKDKYIKFNQTPFELGKTFPLSLNSKLDSSQKEALELCLKNEIALIQGPPGTGKTYVGGILTNILLQNVSSPILVVCYTNHALDQFIEHIMAYTNRIVRIGGRCSNENVKQFVIRNLREYKKNFNKINKQIYQLSDDLNDYLDILNFKRGIHYEDAIAYFPIIVEKIITDFYELVGNLERYKDDDEALFKCWSNKMKIGKIYSLFNIQENEYFLFDNFCKIKNTLVYLRKNGPRENINYNENENNNNVNNNNNNNNYNNINNGNNLLEDNESEDDEEAIEENLERLEYEFNESFDDNTSEEEDSEDEYTEEDIDLRFQLSKEQILNIIENNNLWEIGPQIRNEIINYMKDEILLNEDFFDYELIQKYENALNQKITMELIEDSKIISQNKIIAMTTTGCAKYSTILEQNNFEVVIIEEAAEVLEPHIVSLLTKHTKHLIMIGDHQQLRPKPYNYELTAKYHFDVSLFERLINNGIPYKTLKYQRRMKSSFADFVRLIYGKQDYYDYIDNNNEEKLRGMEKDMFIVTHNNPEIEDINLSSKKNEFEAKYLVKLCKYFLLQGYDVSQITILTFYVGQVLLLRKLSKIEGINVRISSVDNYQGEENDIILLSLVRSNSESSIGFLRNFNRVCVAFSRAKKGFIIVGNIDCLIKGEEKARKEKVFDSRMNKLWFKIKELAKKKEIISDKLTLMCQKHKNKTIITNLLDFSKIPEGGCKEKCGERLDCGHLCELLCHPYNHKEIKCKKPCIKILPCGHKCTKLCFQDCGKCLTKIRKVLKCGHSGLYECYLDINTIKCLEKCNKIKKCGHICKLKCYEDCEKELCREEVEKKLLCGHKGKFECHLPLYKCKCKEPCNTTLKCGHICSGNCGKCLMGTLHIPCTNECGKGLICGHRCKQTCSQECLCKEKCPNQCKHSECNKLCCEKCIDCVERCEIGCIHRQCDKLCYQICDINRCNKRCQKKMKCGHQCMGLCGERCPNLCKICEPNNENFDIFFGHEDDEDAIFYRTKCRHCIEVRDMDKYMDEDNSIKIPVCPKCKTILFDEPRYQNVIKNRFIDVQKIKIILLKRNGSNEYLNKSKTIIENVLNDLQLGMINSLNKFNPNLLKLLKDTYQVCTSFNPDIIQAKLITTYNILTQLPHFIAIEYYQKTLIEKEKQNILLSLIQQKYLLNYNIIKEYFIGYKSFNNNFFEDFQNKINNLLCFIKVEETQSLSDLFVFGRDTLKPQFDKTNFNCSKEELEKYKIISKYKAETILRSLGTQWYRCPNGHYYVVGDCGRTMQLSRCPDCGASIGGMNHIPQDGNVVVDPQQMLNQIYGP